MFSAIWPAAPRSGCSCSPGPGSGEGGAGGADAGGGGHGAAVFLRGARLIEDVLPAFVDGGAVVQILLIELVFEPAIDTQFGFRFRHWRDDLSGVAVTIIAR